MTKTRWTGTVAGLAVSLLREDLDGTSPGPGPAPAPEPEPHPGDDTDPEPAPAPKPNPQPSPNPNPPPVGSIPIFTKRATEPATPSSMWGYAEPTPAPGLMATPEGSGTVLCAYGADGPDEDDQPDPITIPNLLAFPKPFLGGTRSYKKTTLSGLPVAARDAASSGVIEITDDGVWPMSDWRVSKSGSYILKQDGEYICPGQTLPGSKGMFQLGIGDVASMWALFVNGAILRDADLSTADGANGAVARITRCAAVCIVGPGEFANDQMPILHDGYYNGVRGLILDVEGITFSDSGATNTPQPGRSHPIYTQLELEYVRIAKCILRSVKNEGNFTQIRGRQSLIEDNLYEWLQSNASRLLNVPHVGLHTFRRNRAVFGPARPNVAPFGVGTATDAKLVDNHKGPNGVHIHNNVLDFRQAGGNYPTGGLVQCGAITPRAWVNVHDNQVLLPAA